MFELISIIHREDGLHKRAACGAGSAAMGSCYRRKRQSGSFRASRSRAGSVIAVLVTSSHRMP